MLLDFTGALAVGATIAIIVVAVGSSAFTRLDRKAAFAGVAGAWVGLVATIAAKGGLDSVQVLGGLFALPFVVMGALSASSAAFRSSLLRISPALIIELNIPRVLGLQFLLMAAAGRMSGPFPYFAGIGDILTGFFALRAARTATSQGTNSASVLAWNAFGALDLIVAVALGVTSAPGSALQLIHSGVGSGAIRHLPIALIPAFLVPFYLIGHALIFISARRAERVGRRHLDRTHVTTAISAT